MSHVSKYTTDSVRAFVHAVAGGILRYEQATPHPTTPYPLRETLLLHIDDMLFSNLPERILSSEDKESLLSIKNFLDLALDDPHTPNHYP